MSEVTTRKEDAIIKAEEILSNIKEEKKTLRGQLQEITKTLEKDRAIAFKYQNEVKEIEDKLTTIKLKLEDLTEQEKEYLKKYEGMSDDKIALTIITESLQDVIAERDHWKAEALYWQRLYKNDQNSLLDLANNDETPEPKKETTEETPEEKVDKECKKELEKEKKKKDKKAEPKKAKKDDEVNPEEIREQLAKEGEKNAKGNK